MAHINKAYIETFGCQMNERDSEIMGQLLCRSGYQLTNEIDQADLIVVNTCSIRGKAEQKAMSLLGRLKYDKKKNPNLIIAMTGCVAQQEGSSILDKIPHVDLVVGPQNIYRLPELVKIAAAGGTRQTAISQSDAFEIPSFIPDLESTAVAHRKFVTIMQGCNNFCTYCVVPHTRGREVSRPPDDIADEIRNLLKAGVKEVTLLGQNVNSYGLDRPAGTYPDFPELLRMVAGIDGIERLRFTTSNPKDLAGKLMSCFAEIDNLCPHFHLPVQSGSNSILKKMNRKYTIEQYLEKVAGLRQYSPDIAITTDIIVGFPGETDTDFDSTMQLLEKVRYHGAYSFKYSDRPKTVSATFPDKVAENVKKERLSRLQIRQQEITVERNMEYVGHRMKVMVEGESRTGDGQWSGRTTTNLIVNFNGIPGLEPGRIHEVLIERACQHSLRGKILSREAAETAIILSRTK